MATTDPQWWFAFDLAQASQAGSGTVYATLIRLEGWGLVETRLEPGVMDRSPRRMYRWAGPVQSPRADP